MSTYLGTIIKDLDVTTPTEGATPPAELNDSDREIKTVLKNIHSIQTKTGTYTALITDEFIICNGASFTLTLPAAASAASSSFFKRLIVINIHATGVVTIDGNGAETIDGAATYSLSTQYSSVVLYTNGTAWFTQGISTVTTALIADAAVTAAKIASDAVTTAKILDANVTAGKIASDAVTTAKILDANVTAAKLASDAVETAKIKDANVTAAKLASDAVETAKIKDAAVTAAKIGALAVALAKLSGTITTQTVDYTALVTDEVITMDAAISKTVTLYAASGNTGRILTICRLGAGDVVVDGNASETIEARGAANTTYTLSTAALGGGYNCDIRSVTILCTGTGWLVIGAEAYATS